jgi:chaperonin GroEL (HSP60 family)
MSSKIVNEYSEMISEIVVDACLAVREEVEGENMVDLDRIQIQKKEGDSIEETKFISGLILDKEIVNSGMPKRVEKAKILSPSVFEKIAFFFERRFFANTQGRL